GFNLAPTSLGWYAAKVLRFGRTQPTCFLLALTSLILYWPVTHFAFINHDDPEYIVNNPMVHGGLTGEGVVWAIKSFYASNWHPITWMSHMLDCQVWGAAAGGHHLTNVALHVANTVILFLLLRRLTGSSRGGEALINCGARS